MSIGSVASGEVGENALRLAPLLMSIADAKQMLCVGHTIYELIGSGEIEVVKQGKKAASSSHRPSPTSNGCAPRPRLTGRGVNDARLKSGEGRARTSGTRPSR